MSSPFPKTKIEGITDVKTIIVLTGSFNGLPAAHRDIPFRREGFTSTSSFNTVTNVTSSAFLNFSPFGAPIELVSTSANDTLLGTRARKVRVWGLGPAPDYKELVIDVNMAGTTPVAVTGGFTFINKINIIDSGTPYSTNDGTITLRNTATPTTIYAQIDANNGNTSESGVFVIPGDSYGVYHGVDINTSHSASGTLFRILVAATVDEFMPTTTLPVFNQIIDTSLVAGTVVKLEDMNILPPLSIITLSAYPLAQANNGRVSGRFSLSIIKKSDGTGAAIGY